jgi:hypothetical protein
VSFFMNWSDLKQAKDSNMSPALLLSHDLNLICAVPKSSGTCFSLRKCVAHERILNVSDCSTKQVGDVNYSLNNPAGDTHKLPFFIMCSLTEHRLRRSPRGAAGMDVCNYIHRKRNLFCLKVERPRAHSDCSLIILFGTFCAS